MRPRHGILLLALLLAGCRDPRPVQATGGWRVVDSAGSLTRSAGLYLERDSLDAMPGMRPGSPPWHPTLKVDARPSGTLRLPIGNALLGSAPFANAPVWLSVDGGAAAPVRADVLATWTELPRSTAERMRGGRVATFVLRTRDGSPPIRLRYELDGLHESLARLQAEAAARDAAATPAGVLRGLF